MLNKVLFKRRKMRALGSVVDLLPLGDYSEYMPTGNQSVRITRYWKSTGQYVGKAIEQYDTDTGRCRLESDCQPA